MHRARTRLITGFMVALALAGGLAGCKPGQSQDGTRQSAGGQMKLTATVDDVICEKGTGGRLTGGATSAVTIRNVGNGARYATAESALLSLATPLTSTEATTVRTNGGHIEQAQLDGHTREVARRKWDWRSATIQSDTNGPDTTVRYTDRMEIKGRASVTAIVSLTPAELGRVIRVSDETDGPRGKFPALTPARAEGVGINAASVVINICRG